MRIAIVCPYYPFPPSVGGVEAIVRNVSTELARRGHEVHIVTTPFDVTTGRQISGYGVEERDGVTVHKLKPTGPRVGYARILKGLKETIREIQPDIVHSHNLHPHLFQLARWKDQLGYRLVAELHHPAIELDFLIQKMLMPLASLALVKTSEKIDVFIAHTILEKKWLVGKGIKEDEIRIIRFPAVQAKLFNIGNSQEIEGDILYLGRVVRRKGIHILLKSLSILRKKLNNISATIAGPQDSRYLAELQSLRNRLGLQNNVTFKGFVPEEEKYYIIKSHRTLVLPSLKEYTPNILLEAQALGVPIVAAKVGAVPEMVKDDETGILVPPNDAKALANALEILLTNNELWKKMSFKARRWVKRFTLEKAVNKLENMYISLQSRSITKIELSLFR